MTVFLCSVKSEYNGVHALLNLPFHGCRSHSKKVRAHTLFFPTEGQTCRSSIKQVDRIDPVLFCPDSLQDSQSTQMTWVVWLLLEMNSVQHCVRNTEVLIHCPTLNTPNTCRSLGLFFKRNMRQQKMCKLGINTWTSSPAEGWSSLKHGQTWGWGLSYIIHHLWLV